MNVEEFRELCLSFEGAVEKMPFTASSDKYARDVLCFYIGDKWFCFVNIAVFDFCCIKCEPDKIQELQDSYMGITPAWHMNKKHWISVHFDSDMSDEKIEELVRRSYEMVASKKRKR